MKRMLIWILLVMGGVCFSQTERTIALKKAFPDPASLIERDFISTPYDLVFNKDTLIVTDAKDSALKIYSINGDFIRAIGQRGQGPADLLDPFVCAADADNGDLYCYDQGNSRISRFAPDGSFLSSFRVSASIWDMAFLKDSIFVSAFNPTNKSMFIKYSKDGKIEKYFGDFFDNGVDSLPEQYKSVLYGNVILCTKGDYIYALYERLPYIQTYNSEGRLIDTVRMDFDLADKVYEKNITAYRDRKGSRMGLDSIFIGASVDDNKYYLYSPGVESLLVLNDKGKVIEKIFFREKLDRSDLLHKRFIAKIGNLFYFLELGLGQVQIYGY